MNKRLVKAMEGYEKLLPDGDIVQTVLNSDGSGYLWSTSGNDFLHFVSVKVAIRYMESAIKKSKEPVAG